MKRLALKFGGTSVGTLDKINNVAKIINKRHQEGNEIIVIVSAMAGVTNDLIEKSKTISKNDPLIEVAKGLGIYIGDTS